MTVTDLARLSRDRVFLVKASLLIMLVSVGISAAVSWVSTRSIDLDLATGATLNSFNIADRIRSPYLNSFEVPPTNYQDISRVENEQERIAIHAGMEKMIASVPSMGENQQELLTALNDGLIGGKFDEAIERIKAVPEGERRRGEFLGDLYIVQGKKDAALPYYEAEAKAFPESFYSKRSILLLLWSNERPEELQVRVERDPSLLEVLSTREKLNLFADTRDFGRLFFASITADFSKLASAFVWPALFTALIWYLILLSFTKTEWWKSGVAFLAFLAGVFSAMLTLFLVMLQERVQGFEFRFTDDTLSQVLYMVAGVGLREEFAKLLCFLPFAFVISRKGTDLLALVSAGCVGLGFAFLENLGYFHSDPDSYTAWTRLLSANAFHICLTGVTGFYLYRMFVRGGRGWEDLLLNFILMVIAHGLYNSLISVPALMDYGPLYIIIVALVAYRYFDPLRDNIEKMGMHRRISPLGVLVIGSALLVCLTLVFSAVGEPFTFAFGAFAYSVGLMIPLAFVYINRFRDL